MSQTLSSVNLNFSDLGYGVDPDTAPAWKVLLVRALSAVVVIFPAADTVSVFPLIANTLGNNLSASAPSLPRYINDRIRERQERRGVDVDDRSVKKERMALAKRINAILWRLVASLPPIVASAFASDLAFSLQLAGLAGLYVAFVCPALLQRASIRSVRRALGEGAVETIYSGWQSTRAVELLVLAFSAFSFVVVCCQIRTSFMVMMEAEAGGEEKK